MFFAGCFGEVGGGPVLGYARSEGFVWGVEVGGGVVGPQAALGYTSVGDLLYARLDLTGNSAGHSKDARPDSRFGGGARLGLGYGTSASSESKESGRISALGVNAGYVLSRAGSGCNHTTVAVVGFEIRRGPKSIQYVVTPRVERHYSLCIH